jgi:glutathione S-transferase
MALAHKGLSAESITWCFTEKDAIAPHNSEKVPVLIDGETSVADSWAIANYLEDTYPDWPSLFGGEGGRAMGRMLNWWGDVTVIGGMTPCISEKRARRASASRWKKSSPAAKNPSRAFAGRSSRCG